MKLRAWVPFVLVVFCLSLVVGVVCWLKTQKQNAMRADCLSHLRAIGFLLSSYDEVHNHEGLLPNDLNILTNFVSSLHQLMICPGSGNSPALMTKRLEWIDYIYVQWPSAKGVYTNYPVLYDRRLSNHAGKGVNVLLGDVVNTGGGVQGPIRWFWDPNAEWLQKFAREHPDLHVPLPEDIR